MLHILFSQYAILMWKPESIETTLDRILLRVSKPGHSYGSEYSQIIKTWNDCNMYLRD